MRLILIRHGESVHSQLDLVAGERGCPGLTERGREQARALQQRLSAEGCRADVLLSSTVPRAHETAQLLLPAFPSIRAVQLEHDLCEADPGEGDGLTTRQFTARYGSLDPQIHPDLPRSPGGESWNDFRRRVSDTLADLPRRYPHQTVVAVTHAGFVVWAFLTLFAVPRPGTGARLDPDFASITRWEHDESDHIWHFTTFNDITHLPAPTTPR